MNATATQLISKYHIILMEDGKLNARMDRKLTKAEVNEIVAHKDEIVKILKDRKAKAEQEERDEAAQAAQLKADIVSGKRNFSLAQGDYVAIAKTSVEREMLEALGLLTYDHWVKVEVVQALGLEFSYAQAVAYANQKAQVAQEKKQEREALQQAKIEEAKTTGKPVLIESYPHVNFNNEIITIANYAMPDGSIVEKRTENF